MVFGVSSAKLRRRLVSQSVRFTSPLFVCVWSLPWGCRVIAGEGTEPTGPHCRVFWGVGREKKPFTEFASTNRSSDVVLGHIHGNSMYLFTFTCLYGRGYSSGQEYRGISSPLDLERVQEPDMLDREGSDLGLHTPDGNTASGKGSLHTRWCYSSRGSEDEVLLAQVVVDGPGDGDWVVAVVVQRLLWLAPDLVRRCGKR